MSVPTSPKVIQQQLDAAMQNQQSLVQWLGTGGLEAALSAMNQNTVYRGILGFADTTSMSLAGGTDSEFAVCKNNIGGLTIYQYFENVDSTISNAVTSLVGGQWRPISGSSSSYIFNISQSVASIDSEIIVDIPVAQISTTYFVTIEPNSPYAADFLVQGYYIATKTTTDFRIKLASAIGASGTFIAKIKISY